LAKSDSRQSLSNQVHSAVDVHSVTGTLLLKNGNKILDQRTWRWWIRDCWGDQVGDDMQNRVEKEVTKYDSGRRENNADRFVISW